MKKWLTAFFVALLAGTAAQAESIRGVNMPSSINVDGQTLVLNGAGTREKYFLHLYVGGLYLTKKSSNGQAIASADEPMAIRMGIISSMITGERMADATKEGFDSTAGHHVGSIKPQIDQLLDAFRKGINKGDMYELAYIPGKGTEIRKNGNLDVTIPGLAFKQYLFAIWIGDDSTVNSSLKQAMLGH